MGKKAGRIVARAAWDTRDRVGHDVIFGLLVALIAERAMIALASGA